MTNDMRISPARAMQRGSCRTATPENEAGHLPGADWRAGLPRLVNDRVTLRELRRSDAAALHRIACCPDVARYTCPAPHDVEAFEQFIEWTWAERAAGRYIGFGIVPAGATETTGLIELRQTQPGFFRGEFGYFMDPALWGTGLFQGAARLMLDFAFGVIGVHRIEARTAVDNVRSNVALGKLGARKEGILRSALVSDGHYVDQHLWAIVAGLDKCVDQSAPDAGRTAPPPTPC